MTMVVGWRVVVVVVVVDVVDVVVVEVVLVTRPGGVVAVGVGPTSFGVTGEPVED